MTTDGQFLATLRRSLEDDMSVLVFIDTQEADRLDRIRGKKHAKRKNFEKHFGKRVFFRTLYMTYLDNAERLIANRVAETITQ